MTDPSFGGASVQGDLYCATCERTFAEGPHCPADGTRLVRIQPSIDPLIGRNLDGRYTIDEKIGQGGMGAVYRGTQHSVGRSVAIKVISAHLVSDRDAIKRFLREAKLASKLSHPNAVSVLEFGQTEDGLLFLVLELVTGRTLDHVIKSEGRLKPERVARIGAQICDALEGAHALQIVHRDLKPANIMLLSQGRDLIKVLDFGLAKSVSPDSTSTTMTSAGALLGTPAFMPPELALGQSCDGRADLYAVGVILYLLGSGRLPFVSDSAHELIAMHAHTPAPPMVGVPPSLAAVIDRLLQKAPGRRYQTAAEAREALETALGTAHANATPMPGSLSTAGHDTLPSLGPFVAASAEFAHLAETPPPKRPGLSDTMAATTPPPYVAETQLPTSPSTPRASSTPSTQNLRPITQRKTPWLVVVGMVAAAAVAGVFVVTRDRPSSPSSAPEVPTITPATAPTNEPAKESPNPSAHAGGSAAAPATVEPAAPAVEAAAAQPAVVDAGVAAPTAATAGKKPRPAKSATKSTKPATPSTGSAKEAAPSSASGSAALPF